MPVCIVAYLEIIHIQQCDSCRADGLTDNFFVIAAVVSTCQRISIKFFFECPFLCGMQLVCFVQLCFLIFDQLFQRLLRYSKGGFLLMQFFQQPLLALLVVVFHFGKCRWMIVQVLTFFHIMRVLTVCESVMYRYLFSGGG